MSNDIIKIGTSGIVLPGNKSTFPEAFRNATRLNYYSSLFNSVEINSSFYKIPLATTFSKWTNEVSDNFKFTVKLWRGVTHTKKLVFSPEDIKNFIQSANNLTSKAGCLLIQFPASISDKFIPEVEAILMLIHKLNSQSQWTPVVEFRHNSWYQASTYEMLDSYNSSLVIHDMPNSKTPIDYEPNQLAYFRFHGPTGRYNGSYSDDFISQQAKQINHWKRSGKEIYVYFNNTMGDALKNAQLLQELVGP
jgi:uncharacterized protein YecE (DUF72 family)